MAARRRNREQFHGTGPRILEGWTPLGLALGQDSTEDPAHRSLSYSVSSPSSSVSQVLSSLPAWLWGALHATMVSL